MAMGRALLIVFLFFLSNPSTVWAVDEDRAVWLVVINQTGEHLKDFTLDYGAGRFEYQLFSDGLTHGDYALIKKEQPLAITYSDFSGGKHSPAINLTLDPSMRKGIFRITLHKDGKVDHEISRAGDPGVPVSAAADAVPDPSATLTVVVGLFAAVLLYVFLRLLWKGAPLFIRWVKAMGKDPAIDALRSAFGMTKTKCPIPMFEDATPTWWQGTVDGHMLGLRMRTLWVGSVDEATIFALCRLGASGKPPEGCVRLERFYGGAANAVTSAFVADNMGFGYKEFPLLKDPVFMSTLPKFSPAIREINIMEQAVSAEIDTRKATPEALLADARLLAGLVRLKREPAVEFKEEEWFAHNAVGSPQPTGARRLAHVALGVFLTVTALFFAQRVIPEVGEGLRSYSWPETRGRLLYVSRGIQQSSIRRTSSTNGISFAYHYHTPGPGPGGAESAQTGSRYDVSTGRPVLPEIFSRRNRESLSHMHLGVPLTWMGVSRFLAKRPGDLPVYYDPQRPTAAVLRRGLATDTLMLLVFIAGLLMAAWTLFKGPERSFVHRVVLFSVLGYFFYLLLSMVVGFYFETTIPHGWLLAYLAAGLFAVWAPERFKAVVQGNPVLGNAIALTPVVFVLSLGGLAVMAFKGTGKATNWWAEPYQATRSEALNVLGGPDAHLRGWALGVLFATGPRPEDLPFVAEQLKSADSSHRGAALMVAGKLGPEAKALVPDIVRLLKDDPRIVFTLEQIDPAPLEAVPVLIPLLKHPDSAIAQWAARLIGKCGEKAAAAAGPMGETLFDPRPEIREFGIAFLPMLGRAAAPSVPRAIVLLDDENARVRISAARSIGEFGAPAARAVPRLLEIAASTQDAYHRQDALLSIGKIGPAAAPAVPGLIGFLKHSDASARNAAAESLGNIGRPALKAVPALAAAAREPGVQYQAERAIERIKTPARR